MSRLLCHLSGPFIDRRLWLVAPVLLSWIVGTAFSFWWFEMRNLQPFAPSTTAAFGSIDPENLAGNVAGMIPADFMGGDRSSKGVATVLHFWDPNCPCSRFNEPHVRELINTYHRKGVRFVIVTRAESTNSKKELARQAAHIFGTDIPVVFQPMTTETVTVPSSPATAIFDAHGQIAYFGPYSTGALCTTSNGAFVEKVLDNLLLDKNPKIYNTLAFGCFCNWNSNS